MKKPPPVLVLGLWAILRLCGILYGIAILILLGIETHKAKRHVKPMPIIAIIVSIFVNAFDFTLHVRSGITSRPVWLHPAFRMVVDLIPIALIVTASILFGDDTDDLLSVVEVILPNTLAVFHIVMVALEVLASFPCCLCMRPYSRRKGKGNAPAPSDPLAQSETGFGVRGEAEVPSNTTRIGLPIQQETGLTEPEEAHLQR